MIRASAGFGLGIGLPDVYETAGSVLVTTIKLYLTRNIIGEAQQPERTRQAPNTVRDSKLQISGLWVAHPPCGVQWEPPIFQDVGLPDF